MEYNLMYVADLLKHTSIEQLQRSTYIHKGNAYIRLFNSREHLATIPSVFPNLLHLKKAMNINSYDNVRNSIYDYSNGIKTGNRKTDLLIQNTIEELASIGVVYDNNSTTL